MRNSPSPPTDSTTEGTGPGTTNATFTVTRSNANGSPTATYTIAGAAANGVGAADATDFAGALTGQVTFVGRSLTSVITVPISRDTTIEGNERFTVTLSAPNSAGTISTTAGSAATIILNDDFAGGFSVADVTMTEGDTGSVSSQFIVTRTNGAAPATISYTIVDAGSSAQTTATFGSDYLRPAARACSPSRPVRPRRRCRSRSSATLSPRATRPSTVIGDTTVEQNETFRLLLSNVSGGGTIARGVGTATIVDNDRGTTPTPTPTPTRRRRRRPTPNPMGGLQTGTSATTC